MVENASLLLSNFLYLVYSNIVQHSGVTMVCSGEYSKACPTSLAIIERVCGQSMFWSIKNRHLYPRSGDTADTAL